MLLVNAPARLIMHLQRAQLKHYVPIIAQVMGSVWMETWAECAIVIVATREGIAAQCPARMAAQDMDRVFYNLVRQLVCAIQAGLAMRAI